MVQPMWIHATSLGFVRSPPAMHESSLQARFQQISSRASLPISMRWSCRRSGHENRPLIILEAQSAGLPVIASKLGGMAELIEHGRTGLLFQPGDAHDLVRQLTVVRHDATLAESLAAERSRVMTIPREMASLESLYVQLRSARDKGLPPVNE